MSSHQAPPEVTAADIIAAIADIAPDARVEQTGGNVATILLHGDALAIGPGRYNWNDPAASVFVADFNLWIGAADGTGERYIAHDASDHMIQNAIAQAIYDLHDDT